MRLKICKNLALTARKQLLIKQQKKATQVVFFNVKIKYQIKTFDNTHAKIVKLYYRKLSSSDTLVVFDSN